MRTWNQWLWIGAVPLLLFLGVGCSRNFSVPTSPNVTWGTLTYTLTPTVTTTALPLTATPEFTSTYSLTPVPPTVTNTPLVPPTATASFTPSVTNSPAPPTNTSTETPVPPTVTNTPVFTSTFTETPIPPTATNTTPLAPTFTDTPVPPTATNTSLFTSTLTFTSTPSDTAVPPTATNTPLYSPTLTDTPIPPTATNTAAYSPTASFTSTTVDTSTFTPTFTSTITHTLTATPTVTYTFTATNSPTVTSTKTVTPTSTATSACAVQGPVFVHPGAWSSCAELAFVKAKIAANAQPWTQQLNNLLGQANGNPSGLNLNGQTENACSQEGSVQTDAALCYDCALYWCLTGNNTYYTKAMNVLANYATMLGLQSTSCYSGQCQLDGGWFGTLFANACELLRTSPNWTTANTTTYVSMFKNAWYPVLNTMCTGNGNIDLTQIDGMMSMAVFCDDQTEWNSAITRYQARMPAYYYSSAWPGISNPTNPDPGQNQPANIAGSGGNGGTFPMGFWFNPSQWIAGLEQETCRDNGHHVQFALDAAVECAEIDYHQGSPNTLYTTYQPYLLPALELLSHQFVTNTDQGTCGNTAWNPQGQVLDTFEIGYNEYANRKALSMPWTSQWVTSLRANNNTTWIQFNIAWETLTHAGVN